MNDELFDVVFFGILQACKDKETVMQNMATLFKTDVDKLAPYFAGGRKVIKSNVNAATAEKYQSALENIGLVVKLEACVNGVEAAQENEKTEETNPTGKTSSEPETVDGNSSITIAPVGADVLVNPVEKPAQEIGDISSLTMAETGADVLVNQVEKPAQEIGDISKFTMAEVGSDVLDKPREVVAQKIGDISDLSMAETGADLIENPKPQVKTPIADTSELTLDT